MPHPLRMLEIESNVTSKMLIIETHIDAIYNRRPAMIFFPGSELNNDPSNWWAPNIVALKSMLHYAKFSKVDVIYCTQFFKRLIQAGKDIIRGKNGLNSLQKGRAVLHAYK